MPPFSFLLSLSPSPHIFRPKKERIFCYKGEIPKSEFGKIGEEKRKEKKIRTKCKKARKEVRGERGGKERRKIRIEGEGGGGKARE